MNEREMLMVFANNGVRKASMEDIARAAGVSRQWIYRKFGSKEGALEWILTSFLDQTFERAQAALRESTSEDAKTTVLRVYEIWVGELVPILNTTPHGSEVLDLGLRTAKDASVDWEGDLELKVARFLVSAGLADSMDVAVEQTFAIRMASKGLMLKASTEDEFSQQLSRVIAVILR